MTTVPAPAPPNPGPGVHPLRYMFSDMLTVTWRNLLALTRIPEALFFTTLQPIMFVMLFRYVFGGAIPIPGGVPYVDYMMPGIFVQAVMFGAVGTSVGLAEDLQKGLIERFRALPMARSAVLAGRTTADAARNIFVVLIMTGVAFAVGFRIQTTVIDYVLGAGLLVAFAYSMSWGFAAIGLAAPNSETAQVMAFPILIPLTFASTAFVPIQALPGWLQVFARHQPVSVVINGARSLMVGGYYHSTSSLWYALLWIAGLLIALVPLGVWRYRKTS
ncbi:MAG TPA: ABC transporter permease [Acidimicrobiales bacterium]|nr:ABC transporter permease [Acidimicrobiales bacterium]